MVKNFLVFILIIFTAGCGVSQKTVGKRISSINYSDGINRREAIAIAQQRLYEEGGEGAYKNTNTLPHEVWRRNYWEGDYVDWLGKPQKWLSHFNPLRHSSMQQTVVTHVHRREVWLIGFPEKTALHLGFFAFSLSRYYVVIDPKTGEVLQSYSLK